MQHSFALLVLLHMQVCLLLKDCEWKVVLNDFDNLGGDQAVFFRQRPVTSIASVLQNLTDSAIDLNDKNSHYLGFPYYLKISLTCITQDAAKVIRNAHLTGLRPIVTITFEAPVNTEHQKPEQLQIEMKGAPYRLQGPCASEEVCRMCWYTPMPMKNWSVVMEVLVESNGLGLEVDSKRFFMNINGYMKETETGLQSSLGEKVTSLVEMMSLYSPSRPIWSTFNQAPVLILGGFEAYKIILVSDSEFADFTAVEVGIDSCWIGSLNCPLNIFSSTIVDAIATESVLFLRQNQLVYYFTGNYSVLSLRVPGSGLWTRVLNNICVSQLNPVHFPHNGSEYVIALGAGLQEGEFFLGTIRGMTCGPDHSPQEWCWFTPAEDLTLYGVVQFPESHARGRKTVCEHLKKMFRKSRLERFCCLSLSLSPLSVSCTILWAVYITEEEMIVLLVKGKKKNSESDYYLMAYDQGRAVVLDRYKLGAAFRMLYSIPRFIPKDTDKGFVMLLGLEEYTDSPLIPRGLSYNPFSTIFYIWGNVILQSYDLVNYIHLSDFPQQSPISYFILSYVGEFVCVTDSEEIWFSVEGSSVIIRLYPSEAWDTYFRLQLMRGSKDFSVNETFVSLFFNKEGLQQVSPVSRSHRCRGGWRRGWLMVSRSLNLALVYSAGKPLTAADWPLDSLAVSAQFPGPSGHRRIGPLISRHHRDRVSPRLHLKHVGGECGAPALGIETGLHASTFRALFFCSCLSFQLVYIPDGQGEGKLIKRNFPLHYILSYRHLIVHQYHLMYLQDAQYIRFFHPCSFSVMRLEDLPAPQRFTRMEHYSTEPPDVMDKTGFHNNVSLAVYQGLIFQLLWLHADYSRPYADPVHDPTWRWWKNRKQYAEYFFYVASNGNSSGGVYVNMESYVKIYDLQPNNQLPSKIYLDKNNVYSFSVFLSVRSAAESMGEMPEENSLDFVWLTVVLAHPKFVVSHLHRHYLIGRGSVLYTVTVSDTGRYPKQELSGTNLLKSSMALKVINAATNCYHYTASGPKLQGYAMVPVFIGCPPGKRLAFDITRTLKHTTKQNKRYFDCIHKNPDLPCFFFNDVFYPFFLIQDMVTGDSGPFLGSYMLRIIGGGPYSESRIRVYSPSEILDYNTANGSTPLSLIWMRANRTKPALTDPEGFNIFSGTDCGIKWVCEQNSPCYDVVPLDLTAPDYFFLVEVSNRAVDKSTYCDYDLEFVIHIHGLRLSPSRAITFMKLSMAILTGTVVLYVLHQVLGPKIWAGFTRLIQRFEEALAVRTESSITFTSYSSQSQGSSHPTPPL
ncbi:cation channel sperm-associated protein subunit gamma [Terrapene carolina triunguis]|uniref:cation channel sperm-associated protein subunit gamma n=1 Tax=Terrapene triunguis TaxID=2587831 RepID=UPI001156A12D|nr:cation channel sperm-associated protein subunit gamma [Terrapene carolina triunguis]